MALNAGDRTQDENEPSSRWVIRQHGIASSRGLIHLIVLAVVIPAVVAVVGSPGFTTGVSVLTEAVCRSCGSS